jgi:hypothetical protein
MGLELEGNIIKINDTQQVSASFSKREFVIETIENYPQKVAFELTQDKTGLIDGYQLGDKIKVHFNVRGREWNGKYFTNLQAWKIESTGAATGANTNYSPQQNRPASNFQAPPPVEPKDSSDDDLPF